MEVENFVEIYPELLLKGIDILRLFSYRGISDNFQNNLFHYLVFSENFELINLFAETIKNLNLEYFKVLVSQKNRFNETPKDWALAIEDERLRMDIYSILRVREPRKSKIEYYDLPKGTFTLKFLNPKFNLDLYSRDIIQDEENLDTHLYPLYGKNLLKERLRRRLIPYGIFRFFSRSQRKIHLKGQFIEPRFRRSYLHLYHFFGHSPFNLKQAEERLIQVDEDVSNMNLTIKRLVDSKLAVKIQKRSENSKDKVKLGRPKTYYKLKEFYVYDEECAELIENIEEKESENIAKLLNPIRLMFRWFTAEVTEREHIFMIFALVKEYYKVFLGKETMIGHYEPLFYLFESKKENKKRGRKKENVELPLWIRCVSNSSEMVFKKILENNKNLTKLELLYLVEDLFHYRAKFFEKALSYEMKGFISGLILDKLNENKKIKLNRESTDTVNIIALSFEPDFIIATAIIPIVEAGYRINLHLSNKISEELMILYKIIFDDTDIKLNFQISEVWKSIIEREELSNTFFLINLSSESLSHLDRLEINRYINHSIKSGYNSIFIIPSLRENELIDFYRDKYLTQERVMRKISEILERYNIYLSDIYGNASFVKIRDRASSGSESHYGILLLGNGHIEDNYMYFNEEIENYLFTLSWIRESLRAGKINFILEYPKEYLDNGERLKRIY